MKAYQQVIIKWMEFIFISEVILNQNISVQNNSEHSKNNVNITVYIKTFCSYLSNSSSHVFFNVYVTDCNMTYTW